MADAAFGGGSVPGGSRPPLDLSGKRNKAFSERLIKWLLAACAVFTLLTTLGIFVILLYESLEFFGEVPVWEFLFGNEWTALFPAQASFGVLPLVRGTVIIAAISACVSIPLGLMAAIYLSEYAGERSRSILKPILEILAGIPTIVYGFFALKFITPNLIQPIL
ncbi:MAG: phosphate ABC transporter permease subunit PstC, partial [Chloroflexia bacterium]|nr:phosphate ABC transporter permease subunit PstC [Chloroflexia bacterium]